MIPATWFPQLITNLKKFGPRRLALLGIVGLSVLIAVLAGTYYVGRPTMQPIYTGLTPQDVSRTTAALAEAGVPFDVNEQRSAVLVPVGQTVRARTLLAQKGLPTSARAGYELFDQLGSIGLTSFMQEVTRVRALEGEIARTIQGLEGVSAARLHLVLPEAASFRRDRRDPTASVLLRIDGRWQPSLGQVVRHIVAAAVPGMKLENVSVASTDGRILAVGGDEKSAASVGLAELERSMATELEGRADRTLRSLLGSGNYQVSVTVKLDVDRQQINETVFDPKSRIERSVRTVRQSGSSEDGGSRQAVGVESSIPRADGAAAEAERRRQKEDRREEVVNYELNSRTVQTVREGHRIQRLAIAVVVSKKHVVDGLGAGADSGAVEGKLSELKRLVSAATGLSAERGDVIELSATDVLGTVVHLEPSPSPGVVEALMRNASTIISAMAAAFIVLLVSSMVLRPSLKALQTEAPSVARSIEADAPTPKIDLATADGPEQRAAISGQATAESKHAGGRVDGKGVADKVQANSIETVRQKLVPLIAGNEAKTAEIIKGWMGAEGRG